MKFRQMLTCLAVACCVAAPSLAQEPSKEDRQKRREARQREGANGERPEGARRRGAAGQRGGAGPAMLMRLPVMMALDADSDGVISASEIAQAAASLKKLDKNGDGKLTIEELRPAMPAGGGPGAGADGGQRGAAMIARMFENNDANGDGKLSGDELPEQMRGRLERLDTNGDGAIDKDELKAIAQRRGGRPGQAGGRPGRGDGSGVKPTRPGGL